MSERTHYDTLGVLPTAKPEDIRRAYRELAKKHHPDTGKGSEKKFAAVAAAYEVLSEPVKRRKYDGVLEQSRAEAAGREVAGDGGAGHYSWENIANPKNGARVDVSEFDEIYDTFYGAHKRAE